MTSRERVLLTLSHKEADRVPIFKPYTIATKEPFDKRTQEFLDSYPFDQFEMLSWPWSWGPSRDQQLEDGTFQDNYRYRYSFDLGGSYRPLHNPLANLETVAEIKDYPWPETEDPDLDFIELRARARMAHESKEYVTAVHSGHIFQRYWYLRGLLQCFIDMKLNPELYIAIADKIYEIESTFLMMILDQVGQYTDIVMLNDDLGTTTAPFMSQDDFRRFLKPYFKAIIQLVRSKYPHVKIHLHAHGHILNLVPDLIECGVDILQPALPFEGMDPKVLKNEYGNQLSLDGGIDIEHVLPFGTPVEVREHVSQAIGILARGGGYFFRAQVVSPIIPHENIITAYRIAEDLGTYA